MPSVGIELAKNLESLALKYLFQQMKLRNRKKNDHMKADNDRIRSGLIQIGQIQSIFDERTFSTAVANKAEVTES